LKLPIKRSFEWTSTTDGLLIIINESDNSVLAADFIVGLSTKKFLLLMGPSDEAAIMSDLISMPIYRWVIDSSLYQSGTFDTVQIYKIQDSIKHAIESINAQNERDKEFMEMILQLQASVEALNAGIDPSFVKKTISIVGNELVKTVDCINSIAESYRLIDRENDKKVLAGLTLTLKNIHVRLLSIINNKGE